VAESALGGSLSDLLSGLGGAFNASLNASALQGLQNAYTVPYTYTTTGTNHFTLGEWDLIPSPATAKAAPDDEIEWLRRRVREVEWRG